MRFEGVNMGYLIVKKAKEFIPRLECRNRFGS